MKYFDHRSGITSIKDYSPVFSNYRINDHVLGGLEELKLNLLINETHSFSEICLLLTHNDLNQIRDKYNILIGGSKKNKIDQLDRLLDSQQKHNIFLDFFDPNYRDILINFPDIVKLKKYILAEYKRVNYYFDVFLKKRIKTCY